jgi:FixJ family two-component response regulator
MMPHLTGPEAYAKLSPSRPGLRVLYISGYTDGALHVGPGAAFLHKPFTARELLDKVHQVLASPPP